MHPIQVPFRMAVYPRRDTNPHTFQPKIRKNLLPAGLHVQLRPHPLIRTGFLRQQPAGGLHFLGLQPHGRKGHILINQKGVPNQAGFRAHIRMQHPAAGHVRRKAQLFLNFPLAALGRIFPRNHRSAGSRPDVGIILLGAGTALNQRLPLTVEKHRVRHQMKQTLGDAFPTAQDFPGFASAFVVKLPFFPHGRFILSRLSGSGNPPSGNDVAHAV